ncbi:MAG: Uma2 family endonuclease [Verrucomicrobia bacterium]|nr:Uma2 family endonuclease [Verrucomicrobiota bacterium]
MSALAKPAGWISPEEYIEGERSSNIRHEYVDGRVYAMAGASADHNRIVGNLCAELHNQLRGHRCEAFINDMKVKIPPTWADVFYYPDVAVVCDESDTAKYYRERPTIIFEVISPETERTDRQEKTLAYRQIPTVETYVLVEQDRMAMTVLRRVEHGWQSEILEGKSAALKLPEIGVEMPLARIYERTAVAKAAQLAC